MNHRPTVVDQNVLRARVCWKWLRFLRQSSILGIIVCVLLLAFGSAIFAGFISTKGQARLFLETLGAAALFAEGLIVINVVADRPKLGWLAAAVERIDRRFQDRLNTLVFLQNKGSESRAVAFTTRISEQARRVLRAGAPFLPFPLTASVAWCAAFVAVFGATGWLNRHYAPWTHLQAASNPSPHLMLVPHRTQLALPPTNSIDQAWGEVRITAPAGDLNVTKVDVVQLAIEAAANRDLNRIAWRSSVNGNPEQNHALPAPNEPRYAVYQPAIYLDELELSDWDVVTYYAKAETENTNNYASEVYFLEVRPFREDILKLPGGEGGKPYQTLSQLSSLINRQQQVIRKTHQRLQLPRPDPSRAEERFNLSQAELDLASAVRHLYAEMAGTMENQPIGQALDNLAKAEGSLNQAASLLKDNVTLEAQDWQRAALSQLVAARKVFQKAVTDSPGGFDSPQNGDATTVADSSKKLSEMAEFRDEAKSAQEFVQKMVNDQKEVEQKASGPLADRGSELAAQEQMFEKRLTEFSTEHPRPFKGSQSESREAQQSLQRAGESLRANSGEASSAAREATQGLQKLSAAMQNSSMGQGVADAYRLKQMLEDQIRALDNVAKSQGSSSQEQADQAAQASRDIVEQLKKRLEQPQVQEGFGQPLRDALTDGNKTGLEEKLSRLQQAQTNTDRRDRAGDAKAGLEQLDKAFAASEPKPLQAARQHDSLKPDPAAGFSQGLSQLDSLLKQLEQRRRLPAADQEKQARQALSNLQDGMSSQFGKDAQGEALLHQLEQMLSDQPGLDPSNLRGLMDQLERFSIEARTKLASQPNHPELLSLNPERLPLAYRGRIEKYFQKLSENDR